VVLHREAVVATAATAAVMPTSSVAAARVGTEEEAGEEDGADDEDDASHDADPRGHRGETAVAWLFGDHDGRRGRWRISSGQWAGCRF
jgi:hypothetical protein